MKKEMLLKIIDESVKIQLKEADSEKINKIVPYGAAKNKYNKDLVARWDMFNKITKGKTRTEAEDALSGQDLISATAFLRMKYDE